MFSCDVTRAAKSVCFLILLAGSLAATYVRADTIERSHAGSWYNPAASGHGFTFQLLPSRVGLLYWYTYDQAGRPIFLYGQTSSAIPVKASEATFDAYYLQGMAFPTFNPAGLRRQYWGSLRLRFESCAKAELTYDGSNASAIQGAPTGTGVIPLVKLADQEGIECETSGASAGAWRGHVMRDGQSVDALLLKEPGRYVAYFEPKTGRAGFGTWTGVEAELGARIDVCPADGGACDAMNADYHLRRQIALEGTYRMDQGQIGALSLERDTANYRTLATADIAGEYISPGRATARINGNGELQVELPGSCRVNAQLGQPLAGRNLFKAEGTASQCRFGPNVLALAYLSRGRLPGESDRVMLVMRAGEILGFELERAPEGRLMPENVSDGDTLTYPLAFIEGTAATSAQSVVVTNTTTGETSTWPVDKGRYKALVLLRQGQNALRFEFEGRRFDLKLSHQPNTLPGKRVRLVYYLGSDGTGEVDGPPGYDRSLQTAIRRIQTGALLMQTFFAETYKRSRERQTGRSGLPVKTFYFESTTDGIPVVEIVRSARTREQILQENNHVAQFGEIVTTLYTRDREAGKDPGNYAYMVRSGIATLDAATGVYRGGICLGSGGLSGAGVGVCHGATLVTHAPSIAEVPAYFMDNRPVDPRYIVDDSRALRNHFGSYVAPLGGLLHEFGHALSLPHTPTGVMASDFAYINRFFMVLEPQPDGSVLGIRRENELPYREPVDWWHPDSVSILETSPFIY